MEQESSINDVTLERKKGSTNFETTLWTSLTWLWRFGFRLELIPNNDLSEMYVKSGQKWHKNNHITTFAIIPDSLTTSKQVESNCLQIKLSYDRLTCSTLSFQIYDFFRFEIFFWCSTKGFNTSWKRSQWHKVRIHKTSLANS